MGRPDSIYTYKRRDEDTERQIHVYSERLYVKNSMGRVGSVAARAGNGIGARTEEEGE